MQNISIGTIARRTGLAVSAIRYYDDIGLLQSNRNRGGHRLHWQLNDWDLA